ncbi:MAG: phage Gp37/Gp68 family protein [Herpetosiphonaceae bacterium]|nr:phage Gp37/Gp68 family protein [Herpetosiphonaceae bacterium]
MSQQSAIEWTDHTFNPWWGCIKVSQGCKHCYAENLAARYGHTVWGPTATRRTFGEKHWQEPLRWNRLAEQAGKHARVFCASMADVFEDYPALEGERQKLWALIGETPWLDWQLLTKRPQNVVEMAPWTTIWPTNVWIGTSVESQAAADERIPILQAIPAHVRFLSCEPLLRPIDKIDLTGIHWLIAGGESGAGARPCQPEWVRTLRDRCLTEGVPFFFKQWGGKTSKSGGHVLDGHVWHQFPASLEVEMVSATE